MMPKILHCCWFGGPKTKLARKCRASWERFASGWEIREWDEEKARTLCGRPGYAFFERARAAKQWAFAADWVRFAALEAEGGLYLDYDLELVRPLERVCAPGAFVNAHWVMDGSVQIEASALALEAGSAVAREMLAYYASARFEDRRTVGEILEERRRANAWNLRVLPPEVFSPIDMRGRVHRTAETVGIHHYALSWGGPGRKALQWISWHGGRPLLDALVSIASAARAYRHRWTRLKPSQPQE